MSGGSWDYLYYKVDGAAFRLLESGDKDYNENLSQDILQRRKDFGEHLRLVAQALHDIEWVDSGDCSPGHEIEAINKVLGKE